MCDCIDDLQFTGINNLVLRNFEDLVFKGIEDLDFRRGANYVIKKKPNLCFEGIINDKSMCDE